MLPFPLATSHEIAAVLRPGAGLRPDSALRTLRKHGLGGRSVAVVPRTGTGAAGRAVWYSSLMIDVARLYRWRDLDAARQVLVAADGLILHRAVRFLAEGLAGAGHELDLVALDAATGGALSRLALLTESRRSQLDSVLRVRRSIGTVVGRAGDLAVITTEDGLRVGVPAPVGPATPSADGSGIALDVERFDDRSSFMWVRPAFEPAPDQHDRVPSRYRLLTDGERRLADASVLVVG